MASTIQNARRNTRILNARSRKLLAFAGLFLAILGFIYASFRGGYFLVNDRFVMMCYKCGKADEERFFGLAGTILLDKKTEHETSVSRILGSGNCNHRWGHASESYFRVALPPQWRVAQNEKRLPALAAESRVYLELLQSRRSTDGAIARRLWEPLFDVSNQNPQFVQIEQLLQKGTPLELAEVLLPTKE